jgi:hypothetical protein
LHTERSEKEKVGKEEVTQRIEKKAITFAGGFLSGCGGGATAPDRSADLRRTLK